MDWIDAWTLSWVRTAVVGSAVLHVKGVYFGSPTGTKPKFTISTPTHIVAIVPNGAETGRIFLTYSIGASSSQGGKTPANAAGNSSSALSVQQSPQTFTVK